VLEDAAVAVRPSSRPATARKCSHSLALLLSEVPPPLLLASANFRFRHDLSETLSLLGGATLRLPDLRDPEP
jgi:hypothetical protein